MAPFAEALRKFGERRLKPADLSSSEWADVPLALRDRAFFVARVTNAQILQRFADLAREILDPKTVERDGRLVTEGMDIPTARLRIKEALAGIGYDPGDKARTIQDLSSDRRIELVLDQNVQSAQGYGAWLQGQDDDALAAFPAQELFRAEDRAEPRDWRTRWMQAGGQIFGGRMIALKDDPIWTAISAFGAPWPPFDYNSGMWVRDVSRADALSLGLLAPGQTVEPPARAFNADLTASAHGLDPDLLGSLIRTFGDRVRVSGSSVAWADD